MSQPEDPRRRALLMGALASAGLAAVAGDARAAGRRSTGRDTDDALDADAEAMADVVTDALNAWLGSAEYVGGEIHGVVLYGGTLESGVDVASHIEAGLLDEAVEAESAALIAGAIADAWADWADGWTMPNSRAFPDFAAVSTPEAPVTEADPVRLRPSTSAGFRGLRPAALDRALQAALDGKIEQGRPIKGTHGVSDLAHAFAWKVGQRVEDWSAAAMVEGIFGSGPVPTFAPPYVPVGPVVGGDNLPGRVRITEL